MTLSRGKRLAITTAAIGLVVAAAGAMPLARALQDWWFRIPVVRTWRDLLAQEPIDVEPGLKVRLGIEARSCPAGSGVLLYCLVDGRVPPFTGRMDDRLGPLHVAVRQEGALMTRRTALMIQEQLLPADHNLFLRTIPVVEAGIFEVRVSSEDGTLLRKTALRGTGESFHAWSPLAPPQFPLDRLVTVIAGEESIPEADCQGGPSFVALPRWDGLSPYARSELQNRLVDPDLALPTLFPTNPGVELKLETEEGGLLLTAKRPVDWLPARHHLLARWWINGEPLLPEAEGGWSFQGSLQPLPAEKLRLILDWRWWWKNGTLRVGDRIAVQFLYTPQGWAPPESAGLRLTVAEAPCLLTNKVEFVLPKTVR